LFDVVHADAVIASEVEQGVLKHTSMAT
jgi:hypothetical protein